MTGEPACAKFCQEEVPAYLVLLTALNFALLLQLVEGGHRFQLLVVSERPNADRGPSLKWRSRAVAIVRAE
jgi:hypothetical protein